MKIKPIYIYIIILLLAVAALIIFTGRRNNATTPVTSGDKSEKQMPSDSIHKNLKAPATPAPSKDNVSEGFKQEMTNRQKAVEDNPKDTLKIREYADLLTAAHKSNEAIPYYEKILKSNPRRTDILFSISVICFNKGDFANAEVYTKKILVVDKNNLQAQYNLGAVYASLQDFNNARLIWTKLANENPSSQLGALARESLGKLK